MKVNLKQQLKDFNNGVKDAPCYTFYDWFCRDSSLEKKSMRLFKQVETFLKHFDIDPERVYVFFKNNCPMHGRLYDDFRICNIETGEVIYTVVPSCGYYNISMEEKASINGRRNGLVTDEFEMNIYTGRTLTEIYKNLKQQKQ